MEKQKIIIKEYGAVAPLLAAYACLASVPARNVTMTEDFGEPYKTVNGGRCNTTANPAGWIAQHPHFKSLGIKLEQRLIRGEKRFIPTMKLADGSVAIGYNALAYAMEMDSSNLLRVLSPAHYAEGEKTEVADVLKRLKGVIGKAGGGDSLKAHLKAQRAALKPKKEAKKAGKPSKKAKKAK